MGLVKTRRLATMQKQQKAKAEMPSLKVASAHNRKFAALLRSGMAVTQRREKK